MERRVRTVWLVAGLVLLAATAVAQKDPTKETTKSIRVQGSLSMANMVDAWGSMFTEQRPGITVVVVGGGIKSGFKALGEKTAEIAMSFRKATREEKAVAVAKGIALQERQIGPEACSLFVNADAPVTGLTLDQVRKLYKGEISNWSQVGGPDMLIDPCSMVDQPRGPAGWFRSEVMESAEFGPRVQFFKEPRYLVKAVSQGKAAIGYLGASLLTNTLSREGESKVSVLKLSPNSTRPAVLPSKETVASGTYPLSTTVFFYWDAGASPTSAVAEFVDFCAKKGAQ
jgi:phosphate transport system substrate-binding protein